MSKTTTQVLYRVSTSLIALFHISGAFFMHSEMAREGMQNVQLADVVWLQQIIGRAGPLAALVLILPYISYRLKERAYAGLVFMYIGALWAHLSLGHPVSEVLMPIVTLVILILSYCMWHKILKL